MRRTTERVTAKRTAPHNPYSALPFRNYDAECRQVLNKCIEAFSHLQTCPPAEPPGRSRGTDSRRRSLHGGEVTTNRRAQAAWKTELLEVNFDIYSAINTSTCAHQSPSVSVHLRHLGSRVWLRIGGENHKLNGCQNVQLLP